MNNTQKKKMRDISSFREIGLLLFIILISVIIQFRNPSYLTLENFMDLLTNTAILGILAVGMMTVLLTGGIDLSIGAVVALGGMVSSICVSRIPTLHPILCILIGSGIGLVAGIINGFFVSKCHILPIIATLGMMNVYRGLTYMVSGGKWISAYQMSDSFKAVGTTKVLGVNILVIMAAVIIAIFYYFINYTRTGRQIYAVGSNPVSAEITGINKTKILWLAYALMGLLSGFAGVLWVSKFASAQGDTASGYEMNVIAACVLGGVSVSGGSGKVSGLILGALLLGILNNALPLINVSTFWQNFIQGAVILFAVIMNALVKRRADKANLKRRKI